jgi:release factor glutamine methyltransferase
MTAEVLLGHAIHCDRTYFYAHPEQELREVEWLHYGRYLDERMRGKPTQYITKVQEFYGRAFRVTRDVLIPRPETELLVEVASKRIGEGLVIDLGTGSGAIAITLSLELRRRIIATDLSSEALGVAKANAARLGADVDFIEGDLFKCIADGAANMVVSNPPYVAMADRATLQREVRDWEPALALFGGATGLCVYQRLIPEAWRVLKPRGTLALELGAGQADAVAALVSGWGKVQVLPDLAGIPRVLVCEKP